jgi:hypothetical protein
MSHTLYYIDIYIGKKGGSHTWISITIWATIVSCSRANKRVLRVTHDR